MSDSNPLRPTRAVAIFPFGVSANPVEGRHADLSRGLAVLVERRLGRLPGLQPLLQNLFISPESDPDKKGWLVPNSLWSVDQALSLPIAEGEEPTHLLQGLLTWTENQVKVELEVIDMGGGFSLARESHEAPADKLMETFFRVFRSVVTALMESSSAGRVISRLPTRENQVFEEFILGLAAIQAHSQRMVSAGVPIRLLTDAIIRDGDLIEAFHELERVFQALELDDDDARRMILEQLARLRTAAPWNHELLVIEGLILVRAGEDSRAVALLEEYLRHDARGETASQVMTTLARIYKKGNHLVKARQLLTAATSASPENASAWEDLAECHLAAGDESRAEDCWRRALQEDPERASSLLALGTAYLRRGHADRSINLLAKAQAFLPDDESAMARLAEASVQLGRLDAANELVTGWTEERAERPAGWMALAMVRHKMGDLAATEHCLRQAMKLVDDRHVRAEIELLRFSIHQPLEYAELRRIGLLGDVGSEEAASLARKLTTGVFARSGLPKVHQLASKFCERAGEFAKAAEQLEAALRGTEPAPADTVRLARLWGSSGNRDRALALLAPLPSDSALAAEVARLRAEFTEPPPAAVIPAAQEQVALRPEPERRALGIVQQVRRWFRSLFG